MRKRKFIVCALAALLVLACAITPVSARYANISILSAKISINSSGYASCEGYTRLTDNYNSTMTLYLQRQSGSSWSTVASWSEDFGANSEYTMTRGTYVSSGTYRVTAKVEVKSADWSRVAETGSASSGTDSY